MLYKGLLQSRLVKTWKTSTDRAMSWWWIYPAYYKQAITLSLYCQAPMLFNNHLHIFRVNGPLRCGEFTSHRWIPATKACDAELWYFLWSAPECVEQIIPPDKRLFSYDSVLFIGVTTSNFTLNEINPNNWLIQKHIRQISHVAIWGMRQSRTCWTKWHLKVPPLSKTTLCYLAANWEVVCVARSSFMLELLHFGMLDTDDICSASVGILHLSGFIFWKYLTDTKL